MVPQTDDRDHRRVFTSTIQLRYCQRSSGPPLRRHRRARYNPQDTNTPQRCTASRDLSCLGSPLSTVIGRLDDQGALKFTGLSMLSGRPLGQTAATAGRFVEVAIAGGADGYLYFFGTTGGPQRPGVRPCGAADECYRHSYVRLARMLPRNIANSSNGRPAGIEYWVQATVGATWKSTDESARHRSLRMRRPVWGKSVCQHVRALWAVILKSTITQR